jgi:hydrogenase-4 component E
MSLPLHAQLINLFAALLLLLAFAMLTQRRIRSLINLFALQGFVLVLSTVVVAWSTHQGHLYYSALLTLVLKVLLLPWIMHRLIRALNVRWDVETLINIPATMLIGIVLVIFRVQPGRPISQFAGTITKSPRHCHGLHPASVPDDHATQGGVPGDRLPAMENGLFFAATSATYGMPMVVELGIALDVLRGHSFGVFFSTSADLESLDIHHLENPNRSDDGSIADIGVSPCRRRACLHSGTAIPAPELNW